jgi:hypothetical protein
VHSQLAGSRLLDLPNQTLRGVLTLLLNNIRYAPTRGLKTGCAHQSDSVEQATTESEGNAFG